MYEEIGFPEIKKGMDRCHIVIPNADNYTCLSNLIGHPNQAFFMMFTNDTIVDGNGLSMFIEAGYDYDTTYYSVGSNIFNLNYSIQLYNGEGAYWENPIAFKNVVKYGTTSGGHWPGEPMHFRIYPVSDPDYLELYYANGDAGMFTWESNEDPESTIMKNSKLYVPGGYNDPLPADFWITASRTISGSRILRLRVYTNGEEGVYKYLGTLELTHN